LKFDKLHHNKRIALQLQRFILGYLLYPCSFSWVPDPISSRRKSLLNTKLAFPGMRSWSAHMNLCEPRFDDKIALSRGEAEWDCPQAKGDTAESREVSLIGNREIIAQVAQAHYERNAYVNLFHFAYILTSAKYKSLYEKCSKYVLITINAK